MHRRFRGLLCQKRHKAQIHKSLFWRKNIPPQAAHDIGIPLDSMDTTVKLWEGFGGFQLVLNLNIKVRGGMEKTYIMRGAKLNYRVNGLVFDGR